jgi:hypothetical protein
MKEYKKNMDNRDVVFENRKQSIATNAAPVGDSEENVENVELSAIKEEIEKVDAWNQQTTE